MWRQYDEPLVRSELAVLAEHGVELTRSFFYWPDFHPEGGRIDAQLVDRFASFLALHTDLGMRTVPTFLVGHMSGQNWDPPWRAGRDLYRDVTMVERQAWFIREMTARFCGSPAVAGWLISNEMPIYGGGGGPMQEQDPVGSVDHEAVTAWASLMVQAVRAGGGTQPVSLGDGAWGIEISGRDNGFRVRSLLPFLDFIGPHTYPFTDDPVRQHLTAAYICELCGGQDKPVVLEEFGLSTDFVSAEGAGDYYRSVLHTTLLAGATGWVAWTNTDFDLPDQDPYRHHPFEMHFGITDVHGAPKAPLRELSAFHATLRELDVERCSRPDTGTAILVSSYLEVAYPLVAPQDRRTVHDTVFQSYICARLADLAPALVREVDGLVPAPLLLVPSCKALTAPTWAALERAAAEGSTVFVSYSAGETPGQRGPWHPSLDEFFGVRKLLRYGLADPVSEDVVRWTFAEHFGGLPPGSELDFAVAGSPEGRVFLPLEATTARVVARDGSGRPALLCREVGAGRIVLSTYPLEYFAARTPRPDRASTVRLYAALAAVAGVPPVVSVADPRVLVDQLQHADGRTFVVAVSLAGEPLEVPVSHPERTSLADLEGRAVDQQIRLAPYGVRVLRLLPAT
jgi:endo-1,4-beta-mannosidase